MNKYGEGASSMREPTSIEQLLDLNDVEFIDWTYLKLLGRNADSGGRSFYLTQLRRGEAKQKIIAEIASSHEGKNARRNLTGVEELVVQYQRQQHWLWGIPSRRQRCERQLRIMENLLGRMLIELAQLQSTLQTPSNFAAQNPKKSEDAQDDARFTLGFERKIPDMLETYWKVKHAISQKGIK